MFGTGSPPSKMSMVTAIVVTVNVKNCNPHRVDKIVYCAILQKKGEKYMLTSYPIRFRTVRPGNVVSFKYTQPDHGGEFRVIKVVSVRNTKREPISQESRKKRNINRTQFLITGLCPDGTFRSFYEERISQHVVKLGWIARVSLYLAGTRFYNRTSICAVAE